MYAKLIIGDVSHAIYSGQRDDEIRDPLTVVACKVWSLSVGQIRSIFQIRNKYVNDSSMMNHYYWLPCDIRGWLIYNDVIIYFPSMLLQQLIGMTLLKESVYILGVMLQSVKGIFLLPYNGMGDK